MLQGLLDNVIALFDGDPGVRKVADDPVLSAELLLLFRMILADGAVSESEMAVFRRICREAFAIPEGSIDGVIEYLNEFGYETNASQAIAMFRDLDRDRRVALARHMADIAKADSKLVDEEMRMLQAHPRNAASRQQGSGCRRPGSVRRLSLVPGAAARSPGAGRVRRRPAPSRHPIADGRAPRPSCRSRRSGPRPSP